MALARLPLTKDIEAFDVTGTPVNEGLVRELANGSPVADLRNVLFIGGAGTGKTHLAFAIASACIRKGARGGHCSIVDLVNRLEAETRGGKQGRLADYMTRRDFVILEKPGCLPFAQSGGKLRFCPIRRFYARSSILVTPSFAVAEWPFASWLEPVAPNGSTSKPAPSPGASRAAPGPDHEDAEGGQSSTRTSGRPSVRSTDLRQVQRQGEGLELG
jgi:hypothetical protein